MNAASVVRKLEETETTRRQILALLEEGRHTAKEISTAVPDRWSVFFHPGGKGNGGGYLESDYVHANPLFSKPVRFACKASAAGIKVACVVLRYDRGKEDPVPR